MTVTTADTREILAFAHRLADAAAAVTLPYFRTATLVADHKQGLADFDPVTKADREAEDAMRSLIRAHYPDHAILGEEGGQDGTGPAAWVLDPIDGTRAFISGFPTWGTLIAYNEGSAPLVGIMDQPFTGERFCGSPDGAFLGDRRLAVRECADPAQATLFATTPDMFVTPAEQSAFARLESRVKLRRFGGDCYSYCMLAAGCIDLVVESAMAPYDIQALIPIVEAAGGIVTNWQGESAAQGGQILAAGDKRLHAAAMGILAGE